MKKVNTYDWIAIGLVVLGLLLSPFFYARFPAVVPIHWGLNGNADGFGSRAFGAFFFPLLIAGLYLLLYYIPRLDPRKDRYVEFAKAYGMFKIAIVGFMLVLYILASMAGMGFPVKIDVAVPMIIGLMFMVLGNYFSQIKSNWFVGIRTPWTLSSEEVWDKTHKLGGKMFMLGGLLLFLTAFMSPAPKFIFFLVMIAVIVLVPIIYSYVLYSKKK